ncbi:hypothetical protein ACFQS3_23570 [Glycomyces mayteni]|uniref:Uncharacterized protein n=1 Tax=Glycomyces mayteni TaxID=543887 RepID=A0ABW2DCT8_9ACTN|nr:hypothetical protein GCM10025732_39830 [Glycomyces mayteni]
MTATGERNALDPEPIQSRLRALLDHHPDGPLPDAALRQIRTSIAPDHRSRPPSTGTLKERAQRHEAESAAARAELIESIHAVDPTPEGLLEFGRHVRRNVEPSGFASNMGAAEFAMAPGAIRAAAEHLLDTGTSLAEICIGLNLLSLAPRDGDSERIRIFIPLGRRIEGTAIKALGRIGRAGPHLAWAAERTPVYRRLGAVQAIWDLPEREFSELLYALPVKQSADLVQMFSALDSRPEGLQGDRRFARILRDAARPGALEAEPEALALAAQLWDEVRYGRCALLGFAPGEREMTTAGFQALLASPEASASVDAALAATPEDPDLVWLRMRLNRAAHSDPPLPRGLAVRVSVPRPSIATQARTHLLLDGVPLVEAHFQRGHSGRPETVLHDGRGLEALAEPRDVKIGDTGCVEECCGAFRAVISRRGGLVEWEVRDTVLKDPPTTRLTFDADQYDAEVVRAAADFDWEWPARRAARLLRERIGAESELMSRWECELAWTGSWSPDRSEMQYSFYYPKRPSGNDAYVQFSAARDVPYVPEVDDGAVMAVVDRIIADLRTTDPKSTARLSGGSREYAEALGFPWPP